MTEISRVILIVLDGLGIGCAHDAITYGDLGSNTLRSLMNTNILQLPNLKRLGMLNIDGVLHESDDGETSPDGCFARVESRSKGKDSTSGHWEMSGLIMKTQFPVYPHGFPVELLGNLTHLSGYSFICNRPFSGTEVLLEYGSEHMESGKLIVYTSADSVCQIAAHEDVLSVEQLYEVCKMARQIFTGDHRVARIIARPFSGSYPNFHRSGGRRDYSLMPDGTTILDCIKEANMEVIGIGKIADLFANTGITRNVSTSDNLDGLRSIEMAMKEDFRGLLFANLGDFDTHFGHRRNAVGFANELNIFDEYLPKILSHMLPTDVLILTADHGCDPTYIGTDHTRENVPMVICGNMLESGLNLGSLSTIADIGATILNALNVDSSQIEGKSFWSQVVRRERIENEQ